MKSTRQRPWIPISLILDGLLITMAFSLGSNGPVMAQTAIHEGAPSSERDALLEIASLRKIRPISAQRENAPPLVSRSADRLGCTGNLAVTGQLLFAEPGCGDDSLSIDLTTSVTCSAATPVVQRTDPVPPAIAGCTEKPLRRARVELWSKGLFNDVFLFATATDDLGNFAFCLNNQLNNPLDLYIVILTCADDTDEGDACGSLPGAAVPYSVVTTTVDNSIYLTHTFNEVAENVCTGSVDWIITDRRLQHNGAQNIFDLLANEAFDYLADTVSWSNDFELQVRFPDGPTGFSELDAIVHIGLNDEQDPDVVLATYAYFVLYQLYGQSLPPTPSCGGHTWGVHSSSGCAWLHGWGAFLQAAIQSDLLIEDSPAPGIPDSTPIDIEIPSPTAHHEEDEGAVAATLWDLFDALVETWDTAGFGLPPIWDAVRSSPADICGFHEIFNTLHGFPAGVDEIFSHHSISCPMCGNGIVEPGEQCDPGSGSNVDCCSSTCEFEPAATPCDDGEICTVQDTCDGAGTCTGMPRNCDDGADCSEETCISGFGCFPIFLDHGSCIDEDPCTIGMCLPVLGCWQVPVEDCAGEPAELDPVIVPVPGGAPVTVPVPLPLPGPVILQFSNTSGGTVQAAFFLSPQLPLSPLSPVASTSFGRIDTRSDPAPASDPFQIWFLEFDGGFDPPLTLTFGYDETILLPGVEESALRIYQQTTDSWLPLDGEVDPISNTVTVTSDSLSLFVLGVSSDFIFADGFEDGDFSAWSAITP